MLGSNCFASRSACFRCSNPRPDSAGADPGPACYRRGGPLAVTDCNAVFFDAANNFKGCIPGLHEVLRRQGLLEGLWCLDPKETLSPGHVARQSS